MAPASDHAAPVIHLVGDATMADTCTLDGNPARGWGQLLPALTRPRVRVANHARAGRSSKSFIWEGLWQRVLDELRPGDWLVAQFGHNDQKRDRPLLCTEPDTTYRQFLARFASDTAARGARPLFATPIHRRRFTPDGELQDTHGAYPPAMRRLAAELDLPLIDLHALTRDLLTARGPAKSKSLFLHLPPGRHPLHPLGTADDTRLSVAGARAIAKLFVQDVRTRLPDLGRWLKPPPKTSIPPSNV